MGSLNILTAFLFGVLAFLSPCTFPLVPSFLSYLVGISIENLKDTVYTKEHRNTIIFNILAYIAGSILVLVILGTAAGAFGIFLRSHRYQLQQIGGAVVVFFGLYIIGLVNVPFFSRGFELKRFIQKIMHKREADNRYMLIASFLLGIVFTLGWIPCISPILGSILLLASSSSDKLYGGFLLGIYALGQNIPLLLIGIFFSDVIGYVTFIRRYVAFFSYISGILLICVGIIMLLGGFTMLSQVYSHIGSYFSF